MEKERRTGTLRLRLPRGSAAVTYCLGRIAWAELPGEKGLRALERILKADSGSFAFTRDLRPLEESMNLWVSDYLPLRNMELSATQVDG